MDANNALLVGLALGGLFALTMVVLRQAQVVRGRSFRLRAAAVVAMLSFGAGLCGYITYAAEAHGASMLLTAAACFGPLFAASVVTRLLRLRRR